MGWMGSLRHVKHTLETVGADKDEEGKFLVGGQIVVGIGGDELVIGDSAVYRKDGQDCNLASLLNSTSYGVRNVTVI